MLTTMMTEFEESRKEGGGVLILLLALVIWPLTTHPLRDGPPFLLLISNVDISNIFASVRFFHISHEKRVCEKRICSYYFLPVCSSAATIYLLG